MTQSAMAKNTDVHETYLDPAQVKALVNGLSRIEGHVASIKGMIEERRCADELLTQIAAVKSALNRITVRIVEGELQLCLKQCGALDAQDKFESSMRALASMLKHG